jgi:hypothetical protein
MRKWLLSTAIVGALAFGGGGAVKAAIIANLGVDPTSAQGFFANSVGGTTFQDFYTFQLIGGPEFVTIASATNVFPRASDFIKNFTGEVFLQGGATPNPGTDTLVLGPATATACVTNPTICQALSGSAVLGPGNYYLDISGTGGGTSGYGGNLAVSAVPLPPTLQMFLGGLLMFGAFLWLRGRKYADVGGFATA